MYDDIHEIVKDFLWLGNSYAAANKEDLKSKGIKKVLSVWDGNGPKYNENEFIHKKIKVADVYTFNIIKYFGECLNFIKGDEKVFVHCLAGTSRSASVVIAYIMWSEKKTFSEAFDIVKSKRYITPNEGFIEQLKMFEKLLVENNYDLDKINFKKIKWLLN